jgi:S1-C subfamily serine protease
LGVVASLLALFTGAWLVGSAAADSDDLPFAAAARDSVIVTVLDSGAPVASSELLSSFATLVDRSGFPSVFADAGLEQISPVSAPDPAVLDEPGVRAAAASLVKVLGDAPSCGRRLEGSGFVVDDHRVMTNAHVVAGTAGLAVLPAGASVALPATVVVFDPDTDVAILDVPGLQAAGLRFGAELCRGDDAVVAGYPGNGPLRATPARVRGRITAVGTDVYGTGSVERDVYALRAIVRSGNSGGPMLDAAGDVVGMVFAASVDDPSTGYALTPTAIRPALSASRTATVPVSTGACAAG